MKKHTLLVLSSVLLVGGLVSCKDKNPTEPTDDFVEEVITFNEILGSQSSVTLSKGESKTYSINEDIEDQNYIQVLLETTGSVKGEFTYVDSDHTTKSYVEEFFIEPTENGVTDFRQFFDAFRPDGMGKANFWKILKTIKFVNINDNSINVTLKGVSISPRVVPEWNKMLFVEKDSLKVGMDLVSGGTLSYLERTEYDGDTIDLVLDKERNIQVGVDYQSRDNTIHYSEHVNLINIFDAGRQIQQSYYASIGGYGDTEEEKKDRTNDDGGTQNGYTRNISVTADKNGYYWPYNPVQGGDEKVNLSQIIDFKVSRDELYCKTRALDWAGHQSGGHGNPANNRVTKSYMENWFKIKDGLLYATNRFIDWNGFTNLENIEAHNIEIPATYIIQSFNYFQAYKGTTPFKEDAYGNLDTNPSVFDRTNRLGPWKNGGYRTNNHVEDWFAWTNSEDFGVGIYIPGATYYSSGRSATGIGVNSLSTEGGALNVNAYGSPMADEFQYNKPDPCCDYDPCYVRNTSYTAPVKAVKMKEYIPLEYTYVVAVDYVPVFREQFKELYEDGSVARFNNIGLNNWN